MDDWAITTGPGAARGDRSRLWRIALPLLAALALVVAATVMVGPAPKPADAGFPKAPPPLALPSETPDGSPLAAAATDLAVGRLDAARASFTDLVAKDPDGEAGQVGLVLSRWASTGPRSVERDLGQLSKEYPESAFVALHLALVQSLLDDGRAARASLRSAIDLGREAADPTSLRMSRLADDLLHPKAFRGDMPVLVSADEVPRSDRAALERLLEAVRVGDHAAAGQQARVLAESGDPMAQVAAAVGTFDKDDPDATVERLQAISGDRGATKAARDRARFLAALADAWGGTAVAVSCPTLRASTRSGIDPGTTRLAGPIAAELCS